MKVNFHSFLKIVLLSVMTMMASTAVAEINYLRVNLSNGTNASFALADDPKVSVTNNTLQVETSTQTITVQFEDLKNFTFHDSTTGIDKEAIDKHFQLENGIISFDGLKAGETVAVYSISGIVMLQTSASTDGCATIDTSTLPIGVYVVRTNSTTIKISNK